MNVPGLSSRTLRKEIAMSQFTTSASIQVGCDFTSSIAISICTFISISQTYMLDEAAKNHPDSWWWIKADGCDLIGGLSESTRGVWSGDVNLNDGALEQQVKAYQERLSRVNEIS